jgi:hypothetical protein
MSNSTAIKLSQRSWITSKIGWLSVCIIAAAWGNRLLPSVYWENIWGAIGLFGLTSALGLASVAAAKAAHQRLPKGGD